MTIKSYIRNTIACAAFVYAVIFIFDNLPFKFDFIAPVDEALSDFELTDLVYSKLTDEKAPVDTNVILVNIGWLPRQGIAQEIERVAAGNPKVVGLDVRFFYYRDSLSDAMMTQAMAKVKSFVLVNKLESPTDDPMVFDSLSEPIPPYKAVTDRGFANLITEGVSEFRTARNFTPYKKCKDSIVTAFSVSIARHFDAVKTKKFLDRNNEVEHIHFTRNTDRYLTLDVNQVLADTFNPKIFEGKIVLMGFLGATLQDKSWEDKFFSPLNHDFAGKAEPDMFGLVVHANIISMIMEENFVNPLPEVWNILIGLTLVLVNIGFFFKINNDLPNLYDLITKLFQIFELVFLLWLSLMIFKYYQIRIDLSLGLVAIGLCGDLLEIYNGTLRNWARFLRIKLKFD